MQNTHKQRIQRLNDFMDTEAYNHELTPAQSLTWVCMYRHTQWKTGTVTLSYSRIAESCNIIAIMT